MNKTTTTRAVIILFLAAGIAAFWYFDLQALLSFEELRRRSDELQSLAAQNPLAAALGFFLLYVAVTGLSLPGAAIMTLAGGAIFGFLTALVLVSFASSIGATLAFLVSRLLLRDWVQTRFGRQLSSLNEGFSRDGPFYLFSLRLVPVFPFFVINLISGLLPIRTWRFYWVSQLGMLPATAVYVNAGTQLGQLESPAGILSPGLLGSFVLLAVFPFIARSVLARLKARRRLAAWDRPDRFDTNMVVIGAGSAGLVSALIAATLKAKVTLIERHKMGGDCLNFGCVPSKALLAAGKQAHAMTTGKAYGVTPVMPEVSYAAAKDHVRKVIGTIEPHDSQERFEGLGVNVIREFGKFISKTEVQAGETIIEARRFVIATGSRPFVPPIPGVEEVRARGQDAGRRRGAAAKGEVVGRGDRREDRSAATRCDANLGDLADFAAALEVARLVLGVDGREQGHAEVHRVLVIAGDLSHDIVQAVPAGDLGGVAVAVVVPAIVVHAARLIEHQHDVGGHGLEREAGGLAGAFTGVALPFGVGALVARFSALGVGPRLALEHDALVGVELAVVTAAGREGEAKEGNGEDGGDANGHARVQSKRRANSDR